VRPRGIEPSTWAFSHRNSTAYAVPATLCLLGLNVSIICVVIGHLLKLLRARHHTLDMQHPEHAAHRHSKKKKCYTAFKRLRRNKPLARERVQQPRHCGHAAPRQSKAPFRLYRLRRVVAIARDKQLSHSRFCKLKPAHIPHVMNKIVDDLKHNRTSSAMHKHSVYSQLLPLARSRLHSQAHANQHREAYVESPPHTSQPSAVGERPSPVTIMLLQWLLQLLLMLPVKLLLRNTQQLHSCVHARRGSTHLAYRS
jgi:ribosomal protein L20